jgi:hypothetical protein
MTPIARGTRRAVLLALVLGALLLGVLRLAGPTRAEAAAPPWEAVRAELREAVALTPHARGEYRAALVAWPEGGAGTAWLSERFGVHPDGIDAGLAADVDGAAATYNAEIAALAERYLDRFGERVLERFDADEMVREPCGSAPPEPPPPGRNLAGRAAACGGWSVVVNLSRAHDDDVLSLRDRLVELQRERDREVHHLLRAGVRGPLANAQRPFTDR